MTLWPCLQSGDNITLVMMTMSQYLASLLLYINSLTTNDPNLVKINPLDRINMSSLLEFWPSHSLGPVVYLGTPPALDNLILISEVHRKVSRNFSKFMLVWGQSGTWNTNCRNWCWKLIASPARVISITSVGDPGARNSVLGKTRQLCATPSPDNVQTWNWWSNVRALTLKWLSNVPFYVCLCLSKFMFTPEVCPDWTQGYTDSKAQSNDTGLHW